MDNTPLNQCTNNQLSDGVDAIKKSKKENWDEESEVEGADLTGATRTGFLVLGHARKRQPIASGREVTQAEEIASAKALG